VTASSRTPDVRHDSREFAAGVGYLLRIDGLPSAERSAGGIGLEHCAVTDDGVRCALEYNLVRWGSDDLPPQAGQGIHERGAGGLLAAARIYDDVEGPAGPG
jgi:hypothetical protein